jgi:tetratricopeptide (TPR) repeat protein
MPMGQNAANIDLEREEYEAALKANPRDKEALNKLGGLYFNQNNFDKAEMLFKQALEVDPRYKLALNNLGLVYDRKGKTDEAEAKYKEALKSDPNYALTHFNLGMLYSDKPDKFEQAKESFKFVLKTKSELFERAFNMLDKLYTNHCDYVNQCGTTSRCEPKDEGELIKPFVNHE